MPDIDPIELSEVELQKKGVKFTDFQKEMINPMFQALRKKGTVFVGQGPTGMGKTYAIAAVTKALVADGKRVCIAVPSYTHLKEVMARHLEHVGVEYVVRRGLTALEKGEGCPLIGGNIPSPIFCSTKKDSKTGPHSEKCKEIMCTVRKELLAAKDAKVVVTVFHKLISQPEMLKDFDVVIFDESHGLEPALRHARVARVSKDDVDALRSFTNGQDEMFNEIGSSLDRLMNRTEIPVNYVERKIIEPLKTILPTVQESIQEREQNKQSINSGVISAFYSLEAAVRAIERAGSYTFVPHNGTVLAVPHNITFATRQMRDLSKNLSVGLISATIENVKFHANDSGFPYHTLAAPIQINGDRFVEWFKNRPIIGLIDGPVLRKDPKGGDFYSTARQEANKVIASILPSFEYPGLILCRSKEDARSIAQYLKNVSEIKDRLLLFDSEDAAEDPDKIETNVNNQIDAGKNIVLTTASSRLWEGINLKHLRLLVIDALPYASPQPYEKYEAQQWGSWRTSKTFRFMIRRVQQGIGRLMRTKDDPWGVVVVVDGRFTSQWNTIKPALPKHMISDDVTRFVPRERLKDEFESTVKRLASIKK
jgi:Rad3-related DNA helicase